MTLFDEEISPSWCLGATLSCALSEATGIWSVILFYSTVVSVTIFHSAMMKNHTATTPNVSRRRQQSTTDSSNEDLKVLCSVIIYFFTFTFGCLLWAAAGIQWVHPVQNTVVQMIGSLMMITCVVLFILAHINMGDNWSPVPEQKENHELVTDGIFRWARHPMYAVFLWAAIGTSLATLNWLIAWCVFGFVVMTIRRIKTEEDILINLFGDKYLEYRIRVSALGPPWQCLGYDTEMIHHQRSAYNVID
jgi:protein-S-isoprenylcysteine O-methyltransferase Ste14